MMTLSQINQIRYDGIRRTFAIALAGAGGAVEESCSLRRDDDLSTGYHLRQTR